MNYSKLSDSMLIFEYQKLKELKYNLFHKGSGQVDIWLEQIEIELEKRMVNFTFYSLRDLKEQNKEQFENSLKLPNDKTLFHKNFLL